MHKIYQIDKKLSRLSHSFYATGTKTWPCNQQVLHGALTSSTCKGRVLAWQFLGQSLVKLSKLASNLETSCSRELTCTFWDFNHLYWSKNGTRDEIITIEWTVSSTSRNPFLTSVQCFPLWCTNLRILQRNTTSHNSSPAASDLPQRRQTALSGKLRTLQTTLRLIPSSLNLYICGSQLMQFSGVRIINYDESITKTKQTKAHSVTFTWTIEAIQIEVTLSPHTSLDSVGIEKTRGVCLLDKSATFHSLLAALLAWNLLPKRSIFRGVTYHFMNVKKLLGMVMVAYSCNHSFQ